MTSATATVTGSVFDPSGRILFEPDTHQYWLDERAPHKELISVTTAIEEGLAGTLGEEHWTEEARVRGGHVHSAILFHSQNDLDESSLHPIVAPYFAGYLKFVDDEKPEFLYVEERIFDEAAGYAGTFDLLVKLRGRSVHKYPVPGYDVLDLIDVKSGGLPRWLDLQIYAYRRRILAALPNIVIRPWGLHLRKDGSYRLVPVVNFPGSGTVSSERDFLSVLRTAQLKRLYARNGH